MKHYKIEADKDARDGTTNTLLHHHAIQTLKIKIQKALNLGVSHPILISVIIHDQEIETLIMMECCQSNRMKIYSLKKAPHEINNYEISGLEENKKIPSLYRLSIKTDDIDD